MDGYWNDRENIPKKRISSNQSNFMKKHWLAILIVSLIFFIVLIGVMVFGLVMIPFSTQKVYRSFRWPIAVIPSNYILEFRPYLIPNNLTFEGSVLITVTCVQVTKNITIHSNSLTIHETIVSDSNDNSNISIKWIEEDVENQSLIIHLARTLQVGGVYKIFFRFSSFLNDFKVGCYWSSYQEDGKKMYLAVTHFEPVDARRCFPCFDEPALKATFDITVVRWRNMTSLSNMPKRKTEAREEDWEADIYQTSVKMSTYLVAFYVGNLYRNGDDKYAVWASRDNINKTQFAYELIPKFIRYFENILEVPYSLPKLDMISVPEHNSNAMENWGLIIYQDPYLLYDENTNSVADKQFTSRIIAHEISHQWFGNLVTLKWWQDIWLSEGLATYLENLAVDAVLPGWNMVDGLVRNVESIVKYDCSHHSIAISETVDRTSILFQFFNSFTYKKGGMIVRMVHHMLGNETFWRGLSSYLKEYSFDSVEENDLWRHFTEAQSVEKSKRIEIKSIMESWTHNRGCPIVTVVRDYENGSALLTQQSCLTKYGKDKNFISVWKIPLTYTDGRNPDWTPKVKKWLGTIKGTLFNLPGSDHWILMNIQQVGYYRVNYDLQNWKLLSLQLQKDHQIIPIVNRRQLLLDVVYFVSERLLNHDVFLEMSLFLRREEEYKVLETLFDSPLIEVHYMVRHNKIRNSWKNYIYFILGPIHEYLGWEEEKNDSFEIKSLRKELMYITCSYNYPPCLEGAAKMYNSWITNEENFNKWSSLVIRTVFCTAIRQGNTTDWNNVVERITEYERSRDLIYSLGCSTNTSQIIEYLEALLKTDYHILDLLALFRSILENEVAWTSLFDFIDKNWKIIKENHFNSIMLALFPYMDNIKELQELENIFQKHNESLMEEVPRSKSAENYLKSRENNFQPVKDWLEHQLWKMQSDFYYD